MSEVFAWPEGELHLWTGSHTASGSPVAYVTNVNVNCAYAWQSDATLGGVYRQHLTDVRADYSLQVGWQFEQTLSVLHAAQTAVHAKVTCNIPGIGSAGILLYSGRLSTLGLNGADGSVFNRSLNGFSHTWSAF